MVSPLPAVVRVSIDTGGPMQVLPRVADVRGHLQQLRDGVQRVRYQRSAQVGQDEQYRRVWF